MEVASVIISITALLFTIASFWWLQAYEGRLTCFPVQTFAGYLHQHKAALRFPLSIYNSGAVPLVVTDLRLRMLPPVGEDVRMHFRTLPRSVRPDEDDRPDFGHAYSVAGRSVDSRVVEFAMHVSPAALVSGVPVEAVVEAQVGHSERWRELGRFPVHVEAMRHPLNYITYSNQEHVWQPGLLEEAAAAHRELRVKWGLDKPDEPAEGEA